MKDLLGTLFKLSGRNPFVFISSLIGGIGILSWIDALAIDLVSKPWPLLDPIRVPIELVQSLMRPIIAFLLTPLPFEIPNSVLDYMWMGLIVAGMRIRSSWSIWRSLQYDEIPFYNQKTCLRYKPIVLRKGEVRKFLLMFLPVRLAYAFVLWPEKFIGAFVRYVWGPWQNNLTDPVEIEAKRKQYLLFFGSVVFAVALVLFCLVAKAFMAFN